MAQTIITQQQIEEFLKSLQLQGKSCNVIAEYNRNLQRLYRTAEKYEYQLNQEVLTEWKEEQLQENIVSGTVTNRIVKINHFLRYIGLENLCFQNGGRHNLAGMQFGSLVAIAPTGKRSTDRSIYWKCRCTACGKEKEIPANQLKRGTQLSCGCGRANRLQQTNGYIEGTCLKNVFSDKVGRNNTSGYKGVYQKRGKWTAQIQYKGKSYYLGSYDCLQDAAEARKLAENRVRHDAEKLLDKIKETG